MYVKINSLINNAKSPGKNKFSKRILFKKIKNSFLTPRFLFKLIINDRVNEKFLNGEIGKSFMRKFWFWPRLIDDVYINSSTGDYAQETVNYSKLEEAPKFFIDFIVFYYGSKKESKILDFGCNQGRFLSYLLEKGFKNLEGVDFSAEALNEFQKKNNKYKKNIKLHRDFFQRFTQSSPSNYYDAIYSYGSTIEDVHPSFDIVKHMCRITRDHIFLQIVEHKKYTRFYEYEFQKNGFYLVYSIRGVNQMIESDVQSDMSILIFQSFCKRF